MTLDEFFAEAKRIGLTADVFAAQLAQRPEFADCVSKPSAALGLDSMQVVGAQAHFIGQDWEPCSVEHHQMVQAAPSEWQGYETRLIYVLKPN